ncbi:MULTISPECIES: FxsA family protein [unclassified Oleiphilus]|jgi:UPF0716 protein FxsA|uniref:FxsA family protein n=3 Tax=Oleiphilus TaxID=141450 RepID=UPI0007C21DE5|nr:MULTISPECIES: FxsA family protein [unclassified Oleiphilus]KZY42593.1 hypothetical protein A3732_15975 [Oleiphilus sp. HI0050]KZY84926.1 hypothetical protein A3741_03035 [Oleiphilus sp. HI0069]KZZ20383.1 hypothetical protein A3752_11875 [Oleiphilus sp. HI0081]KZZ21884.1 hypothetical protein A3749_00290 [Oleiphilus sp. HI0078]KZY35329.1 hypothetical protein A3729_04615 [Oleiphilus sp. HI0043]
MQILFLLFLIVPIIEMLVLIEVGSFIGVFYTVLLVLLTAVIGVTLLKKQGLSTFIRANQKMQSGQMPVSEIGEGMMLAIAGALLLTPGFVTDTIGFILLTPGFRASFAKMIAKNLVQNSSQSGFYSQTTYRQSSQAEEQPVKDPFSAQEFPQRTVPPEEIAEGEFQEIKQEKEK